MVNRKQYRLKGCPRCGGDIIRDWGYGELEESCLQCGHHNYSVNANKYNIQDEIEQLISAHNTLNSRKIIW